MKLDFQCPVCAQPLLQHQASQGFYCQNKHHFDLSEQGYWVFVKPSKQKPTGDSRQQIRARRFLLETGIFAPMVARLAGIVGAACAGRSEMSHLDLDCGEGFYLRALDAELERSGGALPSVQLGIADAENAIFAAAKAKTPGMLILGTGKKLPLADNSLDLITLIEKPLKGKECLRTLKADGMLLMVTPGPRHLWQLKQRIYPELSEKPFGANLPNGLTLTDCDRVSFNLDLSGEQVLTLLDMTPYAWRAGDKLRHEIQQADWHGLEIDFMLVTARKAE
ncbi:SAM-dependent methyltransferase [Shewanella sp. AS16]|uniref:putative RNA methyltransferase n=1 Tax=Shewanella sp. AS16 TaxID=2907625 RepID=UPI001F3B1AC0|nr:SAM-dependent methyltransferase [Shewanella sp. AS16]MCE9686523.1 SAM-dependent methyltransferase [Shewanella sp. AS16]